ncbi:MAG: GNAT family N-acetyltransferase [Hyphomicrobiaceae bacterium]
MEKRTAAVLEVALAGLADAGAIANLHGRLFDAPWRRTEIERLMQHPAALALTARTAAGPLLVGFLIAFLAGGEAEILSLGVAPERQRHGVARSLLETFADMVRSRDVRRVVLEVAENNPAATALYTGCGFELAGRRPYYYGGTTAALVLAKEL